MLDTILIPKAKAYVQKKVIRVIRWLFLRWGFLQDFWLTFVFEPKINHSFSLLHFVISMIINCFLLKVKVWKSGLTAGKIEQNWLQCAHRTRILIIMTGYFSKPDGKVKHENIIETSFFFRSTRRNVALDKITTINRGSSSASSVPLWRAFSNRSPTFSGRMARSENVVSFFFFIFLNFGLKETHDRVCLKVWGRIRYGSDK